jgi:branched-chain amino acid transport system substrate-binding protein
MKLERTLAAIPPNRMGSPCARRLPPFPTTRAQRQRKEPGMAISRRTLLKTMAGAGALALPATPSAPAIAEAKPVRIGVLAPRSGIAASAGINGLRGTEWAVERFNAHGGIAGRRIELVVEEETSPKDTIERYQRLVQQEKVDCVQGIVSTGVGLALGPVVEEARALTIYWDGTTQDGVDETLPNPKYLFRSTDNECEAVMASLLAIKYWKGGFKRIAGINPDYSYGRNNMAAFLALLKRFDIEHEVVAEQWPKVGTLELTSHVAALKAAKPDLIFSSLLFADLPVFMKQAHAAELTKSAKLVFPAAGWQHTLMKKDFTPEGMIFGHNTLYFDNPRATPLQKEFVAWYADKYKEYPNWEADRAYFAIASYKAAVEAAATGGTWPATDDIIHAMEGLAIDSLGGRGAWRADHIAEQTFVQGFSTHNNNYDFVTLDPATIETMYSVDLQKPPGANFWEWLKTAQFRV